MDTHAVVLDICPYEDWVACRFADVEYARALRPAGSLNPHSGKWNWNFVRPTANDVEFFIDQLRAIGVADPSAQQGAAPGR